MDGSIFVKNGGEGRGDGRKDKKKDMGTKVGGGLCVHVVGAILEWFALNAARDTR